MDLKLASTIVEPGISRDTLAVADFFSTGTIQGEIVGAVVGFLYRGRRCSVEVCGAASSDPTWALGITDLIKAELLDLANRQGLAAVTVT